MRRTLLMCMLLASMLSCNRSDTTELPLSDEVEPRSATPKGDSRDYGPIEEHLNCEAKPRRKLDVGEQCAIELLKKNCTRAADCMVTCISSPDGDQVGGGCFHVCFGATTGIPWEDRPNIDYKRCDDLLRKHMKGEIGGN